MADRQRYIGRASVTQADSATVVDTSIHINELPNGQHRVRIRNFGEGEVQMDEAGRFSDAPFAYEDKLNRVRGIVETGPDGSLKGDFNIERDGVEVGRGSFNARPRRS
jgi:hypothetical protein